MRALVVEQGNSRGALAAVRALHAAGWFVGVAAPRSSGLASRSARCSARHDVPAAHDGLDDFIDAVNHAIASRGYEVVFGAGEAEVLGLSLRREEVAAVVPYGSHDSVVTVIDKVGLDRIARAAGFMTPEAVDPTTISGARDPYVVKARFHARPDSTGSPPRIDTNVMWGGDAVRHRVWQIAARGAEPYVQRFHGGALLAYTAVTGRDNMVVGECMQVATHIWPPHAGASCRSMTIEVDAAIAARAQRMFNELGWFGLAELQFIGPASGEPLLIDLNARFYGSLALALAAGANLPALWGALAVGDPVRRVRAQPGVRYQWLEGDLRRAAAERRGGLMADLTHTLRFAPRATHSIMDLRDPAPARHHIGQLLRRGVTPALRRRD